MYNLNPDRFPGENFNLNDWCLQLPVKPTHGTIETITSKELEDYHSELFFTDQKDGSMTFICPTKGYTTKNSKYCRTELREVEEWEFNNGLHIMYGQLKVTKVAKGKGLIFAQIHGNNPELNPQVCKLYYDTTGNIYLEHKNDANPSAKQLKVPLGQCKLGVIFRFLVLLNSKKLTVCINNKTAEVPFNNQYWNKQQYYFKAGAYVQDNESDDFCKVQYYDLHITHTKSDD